MVLEESYSISFKFTSVQKMVAVSYVQAGVKRGRQKLFRPAACMELWIYYRPCFLFLFYSLGRLIIGIWPLISISIMIINIEKNIYYSLLPSHKQDSLRIATEVGQQVAAPTHRRKSKEGEAARRQKSLLSHRNSTDNTLSHRGTRHSLEHSLASWPHQSFFFTNWLNQFPW